MKTTLFATLCLTLAAGCAGDGPRDASSGDELEAATDAKPVILRSQEFVGANTGRTISYAVALPADYQTSGKKYPVVYWFHGTAKEAAKTYDLDIPSVAKNLGEARRNDPSIKEMIVVAVNNHGNSCYLDFKDGSIVTESEIVKDLLPHVEQTYPALTGQKNRGVLGFSMGGSGAHQFATKFPDLFTFGISLDGPPAIDVWADLSEPAWFLEPHDPFQGDEAYWRDFSPSANAAKNAEAIKANVMIRHYQATDLFQKYLDGYLANLAALGIEVFHENLNLERHNWGDIMNVRRDEIFKAMSDRFAGPLGAARPPGRHGP
jgi:S-formylglutathione hydrolase FrmB